MKSVGILLACAALALPTLIGAESWAGTAYLVGLALIVLALWHATRVVEPRVRSAWRWLAITATLWIAGDMIDKWGSGLGDTTRAYLPQVGWVASYVTMSLAIVTLLRRRGINRALRREIILDTAVVAIAFSVILWRFLVKPSLEGQVSNLDIGLAIAYPAGDLMLIALWTTLVLVPGSGGVAQRLISVTMCGTVLADVAFSVLPSMGLDSVANHLDGVLLILNALLAAAALHPSRDRLGAAAPAGESSASMSTWRVVMLGMALCAVMSSAVVASGTHGVDLIVALVAGVAITIIVLARFLGLVRDREAAQQQLVFNAHHDPLTGLANRVLLTERLAAALDEDDGIHNLTAFYVDLDDFKPINDRFGHVAGDAVLLVVAQRMVAAVRSGDTVARMGGDEFVVLCPQLAPDQAEDLAERLREAIAEPVDLPSGDRVTVGASVGLAAGSALSADGDIPLSDMLLTAADDAMYRVKLAHRAQPAPSVV